MTALRRSIQSDKKQTSVLLLNRNGTSILWCFLLK